MGMCDLERKTELEAEGLLADRSLPDSAATKLSTNLFNGHKAYVGRHKTTGAADPFKIGIVYNLGQGAEKERPDDVLDGFKPRTLDGSLFKPAYPQMMGGRARAYEEAGGIIKRYFGAEGNVILLSSHGRDALNKSITASNMVADDNARNVAVPKFNWPMYQTLLKMARAEATKHPNPGPDGEFHTSDLGDVDKLATIILNPEENPTGTIYSQKYVSDMLAFVEPVNEKRIEEGKPPIFVAIDSPYFHTREANLAANTDEGEYYYKTSPLAMDINDTKFTPVSAVIPGTKAWATASFGMSIIIANDMAQKSLNPVLLATNGLSGADPVFHLVADFLHKDNDPKRLEFEEHLRNKYGPNRSALLNNVEEIDHVSVYSGHAGLTGLLEIDLDYFFEKTVDGSVTGKYEIEDMTDIVEFLFLNHGVVTVNNGVEGDKGYLRLANSELTADYSKAVVGLCDGLDVITSAEPTLEYAQEFSAITDNNPSL